VESDDATLVEPFETSLVRAGFDREPASLSLLLTTLAKGTPRERVLALRGLQRRGALTSAKWCEVLRDDEVDVRREALGLVAYDPGVDVAVTEAVRARLGDADDLVVEAAAFALGELHDVAATTELCVVARDHDDPRCREAAVAALGVIGDDRARATIIAALGDAAPVRRRAVVALSNFEGPDVEAALAAAGEDRDWQVRAAVAQLGAEEDEN